MFCWDFEVNAYSRFWNCNMFKFCELWSCDMNSTLGSVVPLAMFHFSLLEKSESYPNFTLFSREKKQYNQVRGTIILFSHKFATSMSTSSYETFSSWLEKRHKKKQQKSDKYDNVDFHKRHGTECSYSTPKQSEMASQSLTSSGDKIDICSECKKSFGQAGNLKQHMITQSGVIKPCCDNVRTQPKHGKASCWNDKRSQHQGSSWFEKETQLQSIQLLNQ